MFFDSFTKFINYKTNKTITCRTITPTGVMVLHEIFMVWSVCFYSYYYGSNGLNLRCNSGAILLVSWLCFNFSAAFSCYNLRMKCCSQELTCTFKCFSGTQWLRIAWYKGSKWLGASCLKMEAQPASETQCFSVYISVTKWTMSEKRGLYLYVIQHRQNLTMLN